MGIQDSIANNFSRLRRSLFDYKVVTSGYESNAIRLQMTKDMYGDAQTYEILSHDQIKLILDLPDEIPIERLRRSVTEQVTTQTQNIYLYEILPITGYAQFESKIEENDILIVKIHDHDPSPEEESSPYIFVLKVAEILATIDIRNITHVKFYCAPYNEALPPKVDDLVNIYQQYN